MISIKLIGMATNKNALIRYKTLDRCLQNRSRKWTLQDLIDACSDALYEYEGKDTLVSKRTVQLDIQMMRSDKLGYNAPIIVQGRKYYTYEDENYSITQLPIDKIDMDILEESMEMLKQFKDFSLFSEMKGVIQKLEDKVYRESQRKSPIIHMDKNEDLRGLHHLDTLYQAILKQLVLKVEYQSFKARNSSEVIFHPYILKEFNNRWFLIGRRDGEESIINMAIDRIITIGYDLKTEYKQDDFDADTYYENTYGVTVLDDKSIMDIVLKVTRFHAPYIMTKPIHHSQKFIERQKDGSVLLSLRLHNNFELQRRLLGYGEGVEILKPRRLRGQIKKILSRALAAYESSQI